MILHTTSCASMATIILSYCSLRAPVWCHWGMHLKQWLEASPLMLFPTWRKEEKKRNLLLRQRVSTDMQKWEAKRKSVRNQGKTVLDLLEVNAVKENSNIYVSIFFLKAGKRLSTFLVMSLCAKVNSWNIYSLDSDPEIYLELLKS